MRVSRQNATSSGDRGHGRVLPVRLTGFTLLETVIALGLCGLILSATGTATHLYWKYRSATQGQIHASQLLRGLAEDFSADIRSAMPPRTSAVNDSAEMSSAAAEFSDTQRTIDRENSIQHSWTQPVAPLHFVGTSRTLAVFQEHPNSRFTSSRSSPWRPAPQHVIWWVNDGSSYQVPVERVGGVQRHFRLSSSSQPGGLIRTTRQGGTLGLGVFEDAKTGTRLMSAHVRQVMFRYFDGDRWFSEWNSATRNSLPSLVEITILLTEDLHCEGTFVVALPQGAAQPSPDSAKTRLVSSMNIVEKLPVAVSLRSRHNLFHSHSP